MEEVSCSQNANIDVEWKPKLGMEFNSIDEAWNFWNNYGGKMGFGVRKAYMNKSQKDGSLTTCRFVCSKEGVRRQDKRDHLVIKHRPETRTNCEAKFGVRNVNGKFRVYDLKEEHNHELHLPQTSHMLASQRRLSKVQQQEIDVACDAGLQQRATFDVMSRQAGGRDNIGFTRLDQKNYLRTKRQKSMIHGEVGFLMEYFQEQSFKNPSFFHSYQMDSEQQITNIFWADARMLLDYGYFGEVVSFDTTYCTNSAHRPLALFGGLNHHRETIIFGVALLFDETTASFKWLFETFLTAHNFKKPQTIFTDQDQAMAKALSEVMPEIKHGLCTWHLKQNGIKHLAGKMKGRSHFLKDFTWYMYHCVEESKFEEGWKKMLTEYNFEENKWLKSVYNLKEKWAACYMKRSLTLGMQSTQVSESINSEFKNFLTSSNASFMEFFKHYERFLDNKRYQELNSEFKVRELLPTLTSPRHPLLKQLAKTYTKKVFDKFQPEWISKDACYIKKKNEEYYEYIIGMIDEEGEWRVTFLNHPEEMSISCSCRKFESWGFLCSHALKVLDFNDVKHLPSHYILKRWTREARCGIIYDVEGKEVVEDPNLTLTQRYRELCSLLVKLASEASPSTEDFKFVKKIAMDAMKQIMERRKMSISQNMSQAMGDDIDDDIPPTGQNMSQAMGDDIGGVIPLTSQNMSQTMNDDDIGDDISLISQNMSQVLNFDVGDDIPPTSQNMSQPLGIKKRDGRKRKRRYMSWTDLPKKKTT